VQITALEVLCEAELLNRVAAASRRQSGDGAFAVQLRDPQLDSRELLRWGRQLRTVTRQLGASLIVNDRIDIALALGADGVHLGRHSVPPAEARTLLGEGAWLSVSAHELAEVEAAAHSGVQAVLLSPVFHSRGKGAPLGVAGLRRARACLPRGCGVALFALGGITLERGLSCLAAGADGVASIRADLTGLLARCAPC